jgi:hypothetical protein
MKKLMKFFVLTVILLLMSNVGVYAWCIGCGCEKAYKSCVQKAESVDNAWEHLSTQTVEECKVTRKECHGTGIHIEL